MENVTTVPAASGGPDISSISSATDVTPDLVASFERLEAAEQSNTGGTLGQAPPPAASGTPAVGAAGTSPTGVAPGATSTPQTLTQEQHQAAVAQAIAEATKPYGWTQGLNPAEVRGAMELLADLNRDPFSVMETIRAEMARAGVKPPTPKHQIVDVKPSFQAENGEPAYSAKDTQQLLANQKAEIMASLEPLMQERAQKQQLAEQAERREFGKTFFTNTAMKLPYFAENKAHILTELKAMPKDLQSKIGSTATLLLAYAQTIAKHVQPSLTTRIEADVVKRFQKQASGASLVTPGGHPASAPKSLSVNATADDLASHLAQLEASFG